MKREIFIVSLLILLLVLSGCFSAGQTGQKDKSTQPRINSSKLTQTDLTAYLEKPIKENNNLIYCGTFQLAWNSLEDDVFQEKVRLKLNKEFARKMNQRLFKNDYLSAAYHVSMAGRLNEEFLNQLRTALQDKFGSEAPQIKVEQKIKGPTILAYSYLYKRIKFSTEFNVFNVPLEFETGKSHQKVESFVIKKAAGDSSDSLKQQVKVLDYKNEDNFIIKLKTKAKKDEIILANVKPQPNLVKTIDYVKQRTKTSEKNSTLKKNETLQIPKIKFNLEHSYAEIIGDEVLNQGGWEVEKALQYVDFKLNETGATVQSKGKIKITKGLPRTNRSFIFDDPFLVYLQEKGAKYPYLAVWIGNTELLVTK